MGMMSKLANALYLDGVDISPENIDMLIGTLDGRHGWKLVPVEPDEKMANAWAELAMQRIKAASDGGYGLEGGPVNAAMDNYRALLAASPDPLGEDDE